MHTPKCFISYSWDSEKHKSWIRQLATDLQQRGVDVYLDQWHLKLGDDLFYFMESSIRDSDNVILVCTPRYARKADAGAGGTGYEKSIVTGEMFQGAPASKFVPLLRAGSPKKSLPSYLKSKYLTDFRSSSKYSERLEDLLRHLHNEPKYPPPKLGVKQFAIQKVTKKRPEYMTWDERLQWVLRTTRNLALKLGRRLEVELPGAKHRPGFESYSFYVQEPLVRSNGVATISIDRTTVRLFIRVNPQKFNDPFGIFKPMGEFDQELEARVTSDNLEAVVSVARFAYQGLISVDPTMQAEDLRVVSRVWFDRVVRLQIGNFGARSVQLRDYEVGDWGKKSAGTGRIIEPGKAIVLSVRAEPRKFQKGQSYDVHVWTNTGAMFRFRAAL